MPTPSTRDFWNRKAEIWNSISACQDSYYAQRTQRVLELILRTVPSPGNALDVGCGAGLLCCALQQSGFEAYGTDISEEMILRARIYMRSLSLDAKDRCRVYKSEALPFDCKFHLITAIGVFPYVADYEQFLRTLEARLLPGGYIVASCTNRWSLYALSQVARYLVRFPREHAAGPIIRNLLRTGVWSGGYIAAKDARQCYSTRSFDRLFDAAGYDLIDQVDLFKAWGHVLDRSPLSRPQLMRRVASLWGWNHVGVYQQRIINEYNELTEC